MDSLDEKCVKLACSQRFKSLISTCLLMIFIALVLRTFIMGSFYEFIGTGQRYFNWVPGSSLDSSVGVRRDKFLVVPQMVWGLNNQKIAFARACLTARFLNRTLLMPSFSASLFYKEIERLEPMDFDKLFSFDKFNFHCHGFVQLGRFSSLSNQSKPFLLKKGEGRRWTLERDLTQLKEFRENPIDENEVIKIVGKNPFLWHDHWPVKDYATVFECLVLVDEIASEATKVVSKLRNLGNSMERNAPSTQVPAPYVAVHMRVEKDWMIHCKNLEQRSNIRQICSNKEEVMERVADISSLKLPVVVYLAVADDLLEDSSILTGWKEGIVPFEKKKLGVWDIYKKYPYLVQSAIDYDVCLRADVFVGNSFSTFSSLIVLERTQKLMKLGTSIPCDMEVVGSAGASFAYNILSETGGPKRWMTNMSDSSLRSISYGTNNLSC
ncbi:O-fucosyltransferase 23 [Nymphaea colorata]|nr:O-fucosyltransferase 23 [Nymphaea colorata]XP_031505328.1 O-fucosyltransferase 23 [Nymphaea colorata]XP_031505329.1 O-fucosyltransferase 23 [Nymphaea colorata]XP_031505331.1 O-fucosyltransferase 23 [Nymphaea colorata]XP_049931231.1 O-fucosyltransferase 23 [Nymphaea colorata]